MSVADILAFSRKYPYKPIPLDELTRLSTTLRDEGLLPPEIANELMRKSGNNVELTAQAIYSENGLNLSVEEVARALYSEEGPNLLAEDVAWALAQPNYQLPKDAKNVLPFSWPCGVARTLYSEEGPNLSAEDVAEALHQGLYYLGPEDVARALYSEEGLGLSIKETWEALPDDLSDQLDENLEALEPEDEEEYEPGDD